MSDDQSSREPHESFGLRRCPHCEHAIRDPAAPACIYCGLPLRAPGEDMVLLEIPRGLLKHLAGKALESGKSGMLLVRQMRQICLAEPADEMARWAAWLTLAMLLGEICYDWSQPETFVRQIAKDQVDFDRMRDESRCGFSVKRFHADGSPHHVVINSRYTNRIPDGWLREEAEAVLGRYRSIEPERMQELREKLALSMMQHQRGLWQRWYTLAITRRWLWWAVIITLLFFAVLLAFLR